MLRRYAFGELVQEQHSVVGECSFGTRVTIQSGGPKADTENMEFLQLLLTGVIVFLLLFGYASRVLRISGLRRMSRPAPDSWLALWVGPLLLAATLSAVLCWTVLGLQGTTLGIVAVILTLVLWLPSVVVMGTLCGVVGFRPLAMTRLFEMGWAPPFNRFHRST